MENFFSRYKNPLVLMAVLFIQVIGLATQVKRPDNPQGGDSRGTRLIRVWTVNTFTPFERAFVSTGRFFRNTWSNYIDLHDVRRQNRELQEELSNLKIEQVRLRQDAEQAQRLQALLGFRDHYIGQTLPAQVIGTSGTDQSRLITIDKGSTSGVKPDMAVITPDGIVGKVKDVFTFSSHVLMVNDRDSGAGVILQNSRLQGVLKGSSQGDLMVSDIMSDEKVEVGEQVVTSGGDRIFPKGFPVGTVVRVSPDRDTDPFLAIRVKPAADLNRLEEVLVVTKVAEDAPSVAGSSTPMRAADILAQRLPSAPKPEETPKKPGTASPGAATAGSGTAKKPETTAASHPAGTPNKTGVSPASGQLSPDASPAKSPAATGSATANSSKPPAVPKTTAKNPAAALSPSPTATGKPAAPGSTAGASSKPISSATPASSRKPSSSSTPAASPKPVSSATPGAGAATGTKPASSATPTGSAASGAKPKPSPTPVKKPKAQTTPSGNTGAGETSNPQAQPPAATAERPPR
jgi:rod shape-determining protein MreC